MTDVTNLTEMGRDSSTSINPTTVVGGAHAAGGGFTAFPSTADSTPLVVATPETSRVPMLSQSDLDSVLNRFQLLKTITLDGGEGFGSPLTSPFDPYSAIFSNSVVQNALMPYRHYRADIQLKIEVLVPGMCMGAANFQFLPEGDLGNTLPNAPILADNANVDHIASSFGGDHRIVDYANPMTLTVDLPFLSPGDYAQIGPNPHYMWRMLIFSMVPLTSMVTPNVVGIIKIYGCIKPGGRFINARFQSDPSTRLKKSGAFSHMAAQGSSIAATLGRSVPSIAPYMTPLAAGLSVVSSVASYLGFTRESSYFHPEPFIHRLTSTLSRADGVDTSEKFVMTEGAAVSIDPVIGGGESEDPLSWHSLFQRKGLVGTFTLDTTTGPGQVLYTLPVTPFAFYRDGVNAWCLPAALPALPFQKWRGGMRYTIYIPTSSSMRGKLQVLWDPVGPSGFPPFSLADPTNQVSSVMIDLGSSDMHIIDVPYSHPQPMLDSAMNFSSSVILGQGARNGYLYFYLSSSYVAPRDSLIYTRVFVFAEMMDDMKFATPRSTPIGTRPEPLMSTLCFQMARSVDAPEIHHNLLTAPSDPDIDLAATSCSEIAPCPRALMQIPVYVGDTTSQAYIIDPWYAAQGDSFAYPAMLVSDTPRAEEGVLSYLGLTSIMFTGVRGGVRLKMLPKSGQQGETTVTGSMTHFTSPNVFSLNTATHVVQSLTGDKAVEISFPYTGPGKYYNPRLQIIRGTEGPKQRQLPFLNASGAESMSTYLYVSASDDFTVTRFRRAPAIRFDSLWVS